MGSELEGNSRAARIVSAALATALVVLLVSMFVPSGNSGDIGDENGDDESTTTTPSSTTTDDSLTTTTSPSPADGQELLIGFLYGESDQLAASSERRYAAVLSAAEEVNESGGVFGVPVRIVGESNDDLSAGVETLLEQQVDAVITGLSSAQALTVVDQITSAGVIHFSPTNTSPAFTNRPDRDLFFRNAPSDVLQGQLMAEHLVRQGYESLAVIYRDDAYGSPLANAVRLNFELANRSIPFLIRFDGVNGESAVRAQPFIEQLEAVASTPLDAVVIVGYPRESALIVQRLDRLWSDRSGVNRADIWGVDGVVGIEGHLSDKTVLEGMRQMLPSADVDRLDGAPFDAATSFAPRSYDAVILLALAATSAGVDNPRLIADRIVAQSRDGEACDTFAACLEILNAGGDVDYVGFAGDIDLDFTGEPCGATYRIDRFGANGPVGPDSGVLVNGSLSIVNELNRFTIEFDSGSAELRPDEYFDLSAVADLLRSTEERIEVQGFADQAGSAEANRMLSQQRAQAVFDHLRGIPGVGEAVDGANGYGQTTAFGSTLAANRAVRFARVGGESRC